MELTLGAIGLSGSTKPDHLLEASLIERCRRKDIEAFGRLVDAYQARVFGFVRRMVRNPEEAADVTQEVFIRAFQNFERFDGRSPVRTWLFRIAYNLCVDRSRRQSRAPQFVGFQAGQDSDEEIDVADTRWQPEKLVLSEELVSVVEGGIATMSEKLRSVLLLHDREDMPYEEIAQTLNVPVGTVKSRLFLARAHLQAILTEYLDGGQ